MARLGQSHGQIEGLGSQDIGTIPSANQLVSSQCINRPYPGPCVCVCVCVCARARAHIRVHTQLCLIFYNPMDYSPQGSSIHGILQARI